MNYQQILDDFIKDNNVYTGGSQKITYHHNGSNGKGTVILYSDGMPLIKRDYDSSSMPVEYHQKAIDDSFKGILNTVLVAGIISLKELVKENLPKDEINESLFKTK